MPTPIPPEGIIALGVMASAGILIILSKVVTRIWLYTLLLGPSWGTTLFNIATKASTEGPQAVAKYMPYMCFFLYPIDLYLVGNEVLRPMGLTLLAIWSYLIGTECAKRQNGWPLVIAPEIVWTLGRGLPNTISFLSTYLPKPLTAANGLPLIILASILIGLVVWYRNKRASSIV